MKVGDLIYDHEFQVYGLILKHLGTEYRSKYEWVEILYPWGVDTIEVLRDNLDIEVIRESR